MNYEEWTKNKLVEQDKHIQQLRANKKEALNLIEQIYQDLGLHSSIQASTYSWLIKFREENISGGSNAMDTMQ